MLERLYTLVCVVISVMIFQASAHGQTLPSQDAVFADQATQMPAVEKLNLLRTLSLSSELDSAHIGAAASPGPNYLAYRLAQSFGPSVKPKLLELLPNATPTGKLYLAALLRRIDLAQGNAFLGELANDSTPIEGMSGCLKFPSTIGAIATKLLASDIETIPTISLALWNE